MSGGQVIHFRQVRWNFSYSKKHLPLWPSPQMLYIESYCPQTSETMTSRYREGSLSNKTSSRELSSLKYRFWTHWHTGSRWGNRGGGGCLERMCTLGGDENWVQKPETSALGNRWRKRNIEEDWSDLFRGGKWSRESKNIEGFKRVFWVKKKDVSLFFWIINKQRKHLSENAKRGSNIFEYPLCTNHWANHFARVGTWKHSLNLGFYG